MKQQKKSKTNINTDKYMVEYNKINESLDSIDRENLFSQLVLLIKLSKKLQLPLPTKYARFYVETKLKLSRELKTLEKKIIMAQINNENYSVFEERMSNISKELGLTL